MAAAASRADWQRLGEQLIQRRVELDRRYANRELFCKERDINSRLVSDIESGRRTNFKRATLLLLDIAYGLRPGSIERFIQGRADTLTPDSDTEPASSDLDLGSWMRRQMLARGRSEPHIAQWFREMGWTGGQAPAGRPDDDTIRAIADELGITPGDFMVERGHWAREDLIVTRQAPPPPPHSRVRDAGASR